MIRYTLTNGGSDAVSLRVCISEEHNTATSAQERLSYLLSILDTGTVRSQPPIIRRQWTDAELAVISRAVSPADAYQKYRAVFPDSTRTEYSVIKKYGKLRREWAELPKDDPEPAEMEHILAHHEIPDAPICTGDEVTLHEQEPEPEQDQPVISCRDHDEQKTHKKNSWLPDEDEVVRKAETLDEAIRMHGGAFPGKRTAGAIGARWRTMNPTPLQKIKDVAASTATSDLPARGANVRITGNVGRASGKTGTVIRRDQRIGEILVNAGNEGCVWLKPEDVEVME